MPVERSARATIRHRDFICSSPSHHPFRAAVKTELTDDGSLVDLTTQYQPFGTDHWSALPLCPAPGCGALAEERDSYDPTRAAIPESERVQVWLSADGQRVAVPGRRGAPMPDRYRAAGYQMIEASSMRDIDRIAAIRARQTDNEVTSEMEYAPETRRWHDEKPYDPESMTEA